MLLEVIISIFIIVNMMFLGLINCNHNNYKYYDFINDYYLKQCDSFVNKKENYLDYNIYFNNKGNVNIGKTIHLDNHRIIIHLGNGYLTYE